MKKSLLAVILAISMTFVGCSAAWVSTFDSILAAAAPALINILQIIAIANGSPFNANLAAKVNGDAATLKSLASDFANASSATAPQVCAQLNAEIGVYNQDLNQILALAQVKDPATQTKIALLSSLVSGTVAAITAVVPQCQTANAHAFKATPPLKVANFIDDYNAILVAKTGNAAVDAKTPKMKLAKHGKLVHILTFDLVK